AGDLNAFMPSQDGEEPIDLESESEDDEDFEGPFVVKVGKRDGLSNNSNWAKFIMALIECGFDADQIGADITCVEAVHAHFNRLPQKKRSCIVRSDEEKNKAGNARNNDILLPIERKEKAAKSKPSTKAKKEEAADEDEEEQP